MKNSRLQPYAVDSIDELHRLFKIPEPDHPYVSIIDLEGRLCIAPQTSSSLTFNFYSIWIKDNPTGKLGYGQNFFNFNKGKMTFQAPGQVISVQDHHFSSGWGLIIHPDFIYGSPLAKKIKEYAFFSYAVYEGLNPSAEDEQLITTILKNITIECRSGVSSFGQDVIIAYLELFLATVNRIYYKQFPAERGVTNDLLVKVENLLHDYFITSDKIGDGLPTVDYLASKLFMSPHYLSDTLKKLTGLNGQQHIHRKLLEQAKEVITTTTLSISEVAFRLGFGHIQSFSKFFKGKTGQSPLDYRKEFLSTRYSNLPVEQETLQS